MPHVFDADTVQFATHISKGLHRRVVMYAIENDIPIFEFVRQALTEHLVEAKKVRRGARQ